MAIEVTLEELLEAGAHFGHQAKRWNPKMGEYLYGIKDGVHVFDLAKTRDALVTALEVLSNASRAGKSILLVATKKQVKNRVVEMAEKTGIMYVNERWLGGTLTNFTQIMVSVRKLHDLKKGLETGEFANRTKKERLLIERKVADLERHFGGIANIKDKPDLIVIVDIHKEKGAVDEAQKLGIQTIGVVDSNSDPTEVTYPIPMNDDASKSLEFIIEVFEKAILEGKKPVETKKTKVTKAKTKKDDKDNS